MLYAEQEGHLCLASFQGTKIIKPFWGHFGHFWPFWRSGITKSLITNDFQPILGPFTKKRFGPRQQIIVPVVTITVNICSLQQTPIFNSWHFSEIFWTENKKDAFLVKNQNFEKKKIFGSHGAVFLDYKVGKMPKSAHVKNTQITVKT